MAPSIMDELLAGLDSERRAILSGSYETLASVAEARKRLIAGKARFSAGEAQLLLDRIGRNQRLLSSAIRGVQTAIGRIADIDRAHTRLGTYRKDGTQGDEASKSGRLEHRA
jgi:hypothetical protein